MRLQEIIDTMNTLSDGDALTDSDMVGFTSYVGGKFGESDVLKGQAKVNTLEQVLGSPDLSTAYINAIVDSDSNVTSMTEHVLGSAKIQKNILALLAHDFYQKHRRETAA